MSLCSGAGVRQKPVLVLIINDDETLLHSHVHCVFAVVVANAISVTSTFDQLTATWWHADLNVHTRWWRRWFAARCAEIAAVAFVLALGLYFAGTGNDEFL